MGTFKNYLLESDMKEEIVKYLEGCSFINTPVIYRGMGKDSYSSFGKFGESTVRKDRLPKDTPEMIHNMINKAFYNKFKIRARSETLFATRDLGAIEHYISTIKDIYIIIPKEPCKVIYSDYISDLYNVLYGKSFKENLKEYNIDYDISDYETNKHPKEWLEGTFKSKSSWDILMDVKTVNGAKKNGKDLIEQLITKMIDMYDISDFKSFKGYVEAMLYCDKYYYVNKSFIDKISKNFKTYNDVLNILKDIKE